MVDVALWLNSSSLHDEFRVTQFKGRAKIGDGKVVDATLL